MLTASLPEESAEWLEADGLGGYASGTVGGRRTRRYHALLLTARRPPTERVVLVNGLEVSLETDSGNVPLSTQHYAPDVIHPDARPRLTAFTITPWPTWTWQVDDHVQVIQELFVPHGRSAVALCWRVVGWTPVEGGSPLRLCVRPLLSGRDYHSLHHENPAFSWQATVSGEQVIWQPYPDLPAIHVLTRGDYHPDPLWYRQFLYEAEQERGLDHQEDLASPGLFTWELIPETPACLIFAAGQHAETLLGDLQLPLQPVSRQQLSPPKATKKTRAKKSPQPAPDTSMSEALYQQLQQAELTRRRTFANELDRAADAYLVQRGTGRTIVAGYPWFTDWGRDTFIALRGLCLATGRVADAGEMLAEWAEHVVQGMLPNRFPDAGSEPEYNSVDASLWFVIAVHEYFQAAVSAKHAVSPSQAKLLRQAIQEILAGYDRGTRFGIRADDEGLLAAGVEGVQLTWMDAKVGDWVVTPRIGKPVEIQALWLNALAIAGEFDVRWQSRFELARQAFLTRFWNAEQNCLYDVVDANHTPGQLDAAIRPNQILAVGGLPIRLVTGDKARLIVDVVERELLAPLGLRTLSPGSPHYASRYSGGIIERDGAYHQGIVWPWLMGAFVDAWVHVRGETPAIRQEARERFLPAFYEHLQHAGLGHVSEITDAVAPWTPRGCPFQAWSLGELLRIERVILDE